MMTVPVPLLFFIPQTVAALGIVFLAVANTFAPGWFARRFKLHESETVLVLCSFFMALETVVILGWLALRFLGVTRP